MTILVYLWAIVSGLIYYSSQPHLLKIILFGGWSCLCVFILISGEL